MNAKSISGLAVVLAALCVSFAPPIRAQSVLDAETIQRVAASPCSASLTYLISQYTTNPAVPKALDAVLKGLKDPPAGYGMTNPW
ncbi:MAG: hypothetical protein IH993_08720, partial [Proteobacteria bacterium]|nr:hypothetical protein [Pseudomonadota bacterium]